MTATARASDFTKEAEEMPAYAMVQMIDTTFTAPPQVAATAAEVEYPRVANARMQRTR